MSRGNNRIALLALAIWGGVASAQDTPPFGTPLDVFLIAGSYATYRMSSLSSGSALGLSLGSEGGYLTIKVVNNETVADLRGGYLGLPGATMVGVYQVDGEAVGYSDTGGSGVFRAVRWTSQSSPTEVNGSSEGGTALRVTGTNSCGFWVSLLDQRKPFVFDGLRRDLSLNSATGSYSEGVAQAVGGNYVAGILANSGGNGYISLWTKNQQGYGNPFQITTDRTGYVTAVSDAPKIFGWLDAASSQGAQPFVYNTATETLTLLGAPSDLGPIEQTDPSSRYSIGNRSGEPFVFVWPDDTLAGSGIANDLGAVLAPLSPLPSTGTFASGTIGGALGGKNIGGSNNAWVAVADPQTTRWAVTGLDKPHTGLDTGRLLTGSSYAYGEIVDGRAMSLEKYGPKPAPDMYFRARIGGSFGVAKPTKRAWFRITARIDTTGYTQRVELYNYTSGAWVDQTGSALSLGRHMRTVDVQLPNVDDYVSEGPDYLVKARVRVEKTQPSANDNPIYEVEQARWIAEK